MALVGEAHILVRAITSGVQGDIDRAFSGADSAGDKAGKRAGQSFARGFGNNTDGAVIFKKFYTAKEVKAFKKARQDFLDRVVKEIEHMSHLITQVLLLERFENGNQQLQLSHFDPTALVMNTIQRFETMADLKKVTLKTKILGEIKNIDADPDLLGQVLTNLVSNALKFTPEGGCIHILLEQEKACTKFTVEDNGKGIPEDEQHLLFNKFFQAKNQTLKKPIGSGLGLAICKRIIELHHGEIHLTSKVDEGTALSFFIPNFATENSLT